MTAPRPVPVAVPPVARPGQLPAPRYLTVAEIAPKLRVSKMTVYRLIECGLLPAVRIGRSLRVPEAAAQEYLRNAEVGR